MPTEQQTSLTFADKAQLRTELELPEPQQISIEKTVDPKLDQQAEALVELCVNGHRVARGELVVVDGVLAVRVSEVDSRSIRRR